MKAKTTSRFQLVEKKVLGVAQLVAASFDFHGVGLAETDDVGPAAADLRINLVTAQSLVVDIGGLMAPDNEAVMG